MKRERSPETAPTHIFSFKLKRSALSEMLLFDGQVPGWDGVF